MKNCQETMEMFTRRVFGRTGMELSRMPSGTPKDLIGGHIFCRRGSLVVIAVGYPEQGPDGDIYLFSQYRRVQL